MHYTLLFLWPPCVPNREEEHVSPTHTKGITHDKIMHVHQKIIHRKFEADDGGTFRSTLLELLQCPRSFP